MGRLQTVGLKARGRGFRTFKLKSRDVGYPALLAKSGQSASDPIADISSIWQLVTMTDDFNAFIAKLPNWNNGEGIAPDEWISCVGNFELASGYSLIFWPTFVRFENYVLR